MKRESLVVIAVTLIFIQKSMNQTQYATRIATVKTHTSHTTQHSAPLVVAKHAKVMTDNATRLGTGEACV